MSADTPIELSIINIAKGGDGVGRDSDGRVVFVSGALPGERVLAQLRSESKSYANATLSEVLEPSPSRVKPPCETWHRGCGGCDFMHVKPSMQPELKSRVISDALERIGGIRGIVPLARPLRDADYRTTWRASVKLGRASFRRARSHDSVSVSQCVVAHPLAEEILIDGRFGDAVEVVVRVGARTGDRLVVVDPTTNGVVVPDDVVVVGVDQLDAGSPAHIYEEVASRRWRISARSFFQASPAGADALVASVARGSRLTDRDQPKVVDLYSGVGLLSAAHVDGAVLESVESSPSACADARVNVAASTMIRSRRVEDWRVVPVDVVVADPGRAGLKAPAVDVIAKSGAVRVVLVSCDAAAMARDAKLLVSSGYTLDSVELIDMFPNTTHTETVAAFSL
ncbi:MAG: class I SAM-dependent RNA methyltransferase [Acidobacteria bacterium]|nr:class I SAM-dependent RNA methyltransferase [Acidobacteriota bacterium]